MRIDNAQVNAATNPELIKAASYSIVCVVFSRL